MEHGPSVTASLTNGSSLQAHFTGGTPPVLSSLAPRLSLAAGATFHLDRPGARALRRHSSRQPIRRLANSLRRRNLPARLRSRTYHVFRNRHQKPHRRPAGRGPDRFNECMPQRNQPMRRFYRLRRTPRICLASANLRRHTNPRRIRYSQPDRPPPSRHGWQSDGRRHGRVLSISLRMVAALRTARGLYAGRASLLAGLHRHICHRRLSHLYSHLAARRRYQPPRSCRQWKQFRRTDRHPATSVAGISGSLREPVTR